MAHAPGSYTIKRRVMARRAWTGSKGQPLRWRLVMAALAFSRSHRQRTVGLQYVRPNGSR